MDNKTRIWSFLFAILIQLTSFGQQVSIPDHPWEDFYLTTDRDLYIAGETIWFSVRSTGKEKPENNISSNVIYLELYDHTNKVINRGKFPLHEGHASGALNIPGEQPNAVYFLRAYTQYLKNFDPDLFPMKIITIINPTIPLTKENKTELNTVVLRPANGNLVAGIPAQLAFKVPKEMIQEVSAVALSRQDTILTEEVRFYENGLGGIDFTPMEGQQYSLKINLKSGDSIISPLPPVASSGFVLKFMDEHDDLVYTMQKSEASPFAGNKRYYLRISGQDLGLLYYDSLSGVSPVTSFSITKEQLSEGLNYFYLTNENSEVLDFSIYYNTPAKPLSASIEGPKKSYKPGEQVALRLDIPALGEGDVAAVSVAVCKKGVNRPINLVLPEWLINNPLLFRPGYLKQESVDVGLLDQLNLAFILHQPELANNTALISAIKASELQLEYFPEVRRASISGYVKTKPAGTPVSGSMVFLSYIGNHTEIHVNETREDGYFVFSLQPYHNQQDLFLCTLDGDPGEEILINNDFAGQFAPPAIIPIDVDTSDRKLLEEMYINQQITALNKTTNLQPEQAVDYRLGFGTPDISIRLEDYIDLPSMEVVLNEIVPYVKVRKKKAEYRITILDSETGLSYENHLILVDNIPVTNVNELMQIHPAKVEKVDVINRTYILGDNTFKGILMVTTLTENFGGISLPPDAVFLKYPLFNEEMSFAEPRPGKEVGDMLHQVDLRNTLYWNPNLILDHEQTISFYASDHESDYEIVIRGTTRSGKVVVGRAAINVAR